MEANEWKTAWHKLDERLEKMETLEEKAIREMLYTKSGKSLNRLINGEFFSLLTLILVVPAIFFTMYLFERGAKSPLVAEILPFVKITLGILAAICVLYIPWEIYKVNKLLKVDFSGNISENHRIVNLYNIWTMRERLGSFISVPFILAWAVYIYAKLHVPLWVWIFMICTFAAGLLFIYYYYRKIYYPSINTIRKNLDELKELDQK